MSILFEDVSRRTEVSCFVSAKGVRSVYLMLKRVRGWGGQHEAAYMHVAVMALLYYVYNHKPSTLKFRNLFEIIFGDS